MVCSMEMMKKFIFSLFDFDHSDEISQPELVILMMSTTRGLCKVANLERPAVEEFELLVAKAFAKMDQDHSNCISYDEFYLWSFEF